jgi:ribosomal protein L37AE/L43A
MAETSLIIRQKRIALRNEAIAKNRCPNCNILLREKWNGGLNCSKCGWEKSN